MSSLAVESWTWYALTWIVVVFRMISRRVLHGSIRKLQLDDWLMMFIMATDTVLIVSMNIISHTSSNLIDPNDDTPLDAENIKERIFGSKMVLVVEQMQIITIWTVKACLLLMYSRLTMSLKQNIAVKFVSVYVALGFVVMEVLYLGIWCRPFNNYWAVPTDNVQCTAATNHLITNAVLNISSDIMIILIPMPVLLQAQLPLKRKAILLGVFALGAFTTLSAILNKYYSFHNPFGSEWTFWYIRESSTAIITANLPFTWTLLRRIFNLTSFNGKSSNGRTDPSRFRSNNYAFSNTAGFTQTHISVRTGANHSHSSLDAELGRNESQEQINRTFSMPLKIYQHHEVQISSREVDPIRDRDLPGVVSSVIPDLTSRNLSPGSSTKPSLDGLKDDDTSSDRSVPGVITTIKRGI